MYLQPRFPPFFLCCSSLGSCNGGVILLGHAYSEADTDWKESPDRIFTRAYLPEACLVSMSSRSVHSSLLYRFTHSCTFNASFSGLNLIEVKLPVPWLKEVISKPRHE